MTEQYNISENSTLPAEGFLVSFWRAAALQLPTPGEGGHEPRMLFVHLPGSAGSQRRRGRQSESTGGW